MDDISTNTQPIGPDGNTGVDPASLNDIIVLEVDGYWGPETTKRLRQFYNADDTIGTIAHQWEPYRSSNPGLLPSSWQWDYSQIGDPAIAGLQYHLNIVNDGIMGPETICALQREFGMPVIDGVLGAPSATIMELQRRLNNHWIIGM